MVSHRFLGEEGREPSKCRSTYCSMECGVPRGKYFNARLPSGNTCFRAAPVASARRPEEGVLGRRCANRLHGRVLLLRDTGPRRPAEDRHKRRSPSFGIAASSQRPMACVLCVAAVAFCGRYRRGSRCGSGTSDRGGCAGPPRSSDCVVRVGDERQLRGGYGSLCNCRLTPPSSGRLPACFASPQPPLISNVEHLHSVECWRY